MGAEDIAVRLIAGETGIPVGEILSGRLSQDEVSRIQQATQEIDGWPLHIERCNVLDARQLMRRGRQLKRKHGIKLIVVDYLQRMRERGRSFYEQVSEVTRGLKIAAGEVLDLPVLALSQLSRETERRADGVKVEDRHLKRRPKLCQISETAAQSSRTPMWSFSCIAKRFTSPARNLRSKTLRLIRNGARRLRGTRARQILIRPPSSGKGKRE